MTDQKRRVYAFGAFRLDAGKRELLRDDSPVKLYPKQLDILLALVERAGEVVTKDELLRIVWPDATVEEGNLTTHISQLRKLLGDGRSHREYIVTLPGRGYRFVAPLRDPVSAAEPRPMGRRRTRLPSRSPPLLLPPPLASVSSTAATAPHFATSNSLFDAGASGPLDSRRTAERSCMGRHGMVSPVRFS